MKRRILNAALAVALGCATIAVSSCSSKKNAAGGTDTTMRIKSGDTTKSTPAPQPPADTTTHKDTAKKDTTHH